MSDEKKSSVLNRFFDIGIGTFVNIILGLLTTPVITRIADPSEYGQLSVFNAYADILLSFLYLGLDRSLMRFFYDKDDMSSKRSLLKLCFLAPITATLILMSIFICISRFGLITSEITGIYLCLLAIFCIVSVWNRISNIMLKVTYKTKEFSFCTIMQKVVYCLVIFAYVFLINKNYFLMMVLASIISVAFAACMATIFTKDYWDFINTPFPERKSEIIRFGLPFILYTCTDALLDSIDKLTLDAFCTEYEIGIYASAVSLVGIFLIVKTIFESIWIPMQTEHFVKNPNDPTFIQKGSLYLCVVLFFIGINVMMFKDIFCYLLGEKYRNAAQIMPFLYLGSSIYAISDTTMCGIDISKKSYLHAMAGFVACLVNLCGNLLLVPIIGPKGAAFTTFLSFAVYFVVRTYFSIKNYYINYSLGRLSISLISVGLFAYINTFLDFGIITVFGYLICTFIIIVMYFKEMKEMFSYLFSFFKKN